jgi:3-phytase/alkaline phosphatase D
MYRNGIRAFVEYNPIGSARFSASAPRRYQRKPKFFRTRYFGRAAMFVLLDARSFRDSPIPDVVSITDPVELAKISLQHLDINTTTADILPPEHHRTLLGRLFVDATKKALLEAHQLGVVWKFVFVGQTVANLGAFQAGDRFEGKCRPLLSPSPFFSSSTCFLLPPFPLSHSHIHCLLTIVVPWHQFPPRPTPT